MSDFPESLSAPPGRYHITREIGRGFSSLVYEAQDRVRARTVALKVLTLGQSLSEDRRRDMSERFVREAKAISALSHPSIVSIYDVGQTGDGSQFIAMEMLPGESLRARLEREGALPPAEAVQIAVQIADALQYAHQRGIVHRDVKPDNIFVLPGGAAKLMDFGVAHIVSEGALTQTGTVVGSPAYMSPEQISGQMLDGGSDVFSLGVTLAEMLTGHKPFDAPTIPAVMNRILHRPPQMAGLQPRPLRRVLERALAKNPVARYATAAAFADALRAHVLPVLPAAETTATVILAPLTAAAHRRGAGDSRIGFSSLSPQKITPDAARWGGLLAAAGAAAVLTLLLLPRPALGPASSTILPPPYRAQRVTLTVAHTHTAQISPGWNDARRTPEIRFVMEKPLPHVTAAPAIRTTPAHALHSAKFVHPVLVMTEAQRLDAGTSLVPASPALHSAPLPAAVVKVAAARQEQTLLAPEAIASSLVTINAAPRLVQQTQAVFPPQLKEAGVGGTVVLRLSVSETGRVQEATVVHSSGVDDLDAAALDAVGAWRYAPALRDGLPVPAAVTVRVEFPNAS